MHLAMQYSGGMGNCSRFHFEARWIRRLFVPLPYVDEAVEALLLLEDRADAALFAALSNDGTLHQGLTSALFSYTDRQSTRRRRCVNAVKYTGLFVSLNLLDFTITNI